MSARDDLAELIGGVSPQAALATADDVLAAGYRKPRTISTAEEVDALPHGAIVMTRFGDGVTVYRDNDGLPPAHYQFLISEGTSATVLHEPEPIA